MLKLLLLLLPLAAHAGTTVDTNDLRRFGSKSSTAEKSIEFQQNAGTNNPKITSSPTALDLKLRAAKIVKGRGQAEAITEEFDIGAGAANPKMRYDTTTQKLQFSNNGTLFSALGSGAGGGGIVLNGNTGFEDGLDQISQTPAGIATVGTVLPAFGTNSLVVNFTAAAQNVRWAGVAVPQGLGGKACTLSYYYSGATNGTSLMQVTDGTTVYAQSSALGVLTPANSWSPKKIFAFTCPAAGTVIYPQLTSTGVDSLKLDDVKLGQETVQNPQPQSAALYGAVSFNGGATTTCNFAWTSSSYANAPVGTTCSYSATGAAAAPLTQVPGIYFPTAAPAGEYTFVVEGGFASVSNVSNGSTFGSFRLFDGTNASSDAPYNSGSGATGQTAGSMPGFTTRISYPNGIPAGTTIQVQGRAVSGFSSVNLFTYPYGTVLPARISVFRYPTQGNVDASQGISIDQSGWRVDANIGGVNFTLQTATNTTYSSPTATGSVLSLSDPRSATATLACGGTADSTGTTCAGTANPGISFTPPAAGDYEVCMAFGHNYGSQANGYLGNTFQLMETPNTAQTISQQGKETAYTYTNPASAGTQASPVRVCGTFGFSDSSRRTVRLFYTTSSNTGINNLLLADQDPNNGARIVKVTVRRKVENADVVKFNSQAPQTTYLTAVGSGTYTVPTGASRLKIRMVGGGGGGGSGNNGSAGANGTLSSFGTLASCAPGFGGVPNGGQNAVGGACTLTGVQGLTIQGGGAMGSTNGGGNNSGGIGGSTPFGGGGNGSYAATTGGNAPVNSGAGGGGGGSPANVPTGSGGTAGGYAEFSVSSLASSYSYTVGGGGAGGSSGGAGGSGVIAVEAFFN